MTHAVLACHHCLHTGVDQTHPDLNVVGGMNMVADEPHLSFSDDSHGHGTHVAGVCVGGEGRGVYR